MGDEAIGRTQYERRSGVSRRAALKAGVAAGVGVAAWSGASITSLGGTPAYAEGCTGAIPPIDLNSTNDCRNVDDRNECAYAYHELKSAITVPGYPAGSFYINPNIGEGTCCGTLATATFHFPTPGLTCSVRIEIYDGVPSCAAGTAPKLSSTFGPSSNGAVVIGFPCLLPHVPGDKYRVRAQCKTGGVGDPSCWT